MFAGFAFEQITEPLPQGTDFLLEVLYVALTAATLGFHLCVCMSCTFCCIFGKGLALKGPNGSRSLRIAVENLHKEQKLVFTQFLLGIVGYLLSHVIEPWIYFRPRTALVVCIPLLVFFLAIVYYVMMIVDQLLLNEDRAVLGAISAWTPYERIQDLDEEVYRPLVNKRNMYNPDDMQEF
eukprot:gb/GFBE01020045.1/.p1 GENE.gb/GFBE01020045.1/~~gb/GFBE01020045.1/.p1  ORF type:complete len:180 (+),score=40.14 gb/GFBE01020045.1/:1-540(+)